jgi:hypothetical protein
VSVAPGETAELRLRLRPTSAAHDSQDAHGEQARSVDALGSGFERVVKQRMAEAEEFYAS